MVTKLMENKTNKSGSIKKTYEQTKHVMLTEWRLLIRKFQKPFLFREQ